MLGVAIKASLFAGKKILEIYENSDFEIEFKSDNSPLTIADKNSHLIINDFLLSTNVPILSEEGENIPYEIRKQWKYLWIIDPLDGTKEFINRNGDFSVNIALVDVNKSVLGVIFVPVTGELYFSNVDIGAFKTNVNDLNLFTKITLQDILKFSTKLPVIDSNRKFTIVSSRSNKSTETEKIISEFTTKHTEHNIVFRGSSLKMCMVAEGSADIYPRFGPTMEWDTAAGQAIAISAGAEFKIAGTNNDLVYNKENLLNPDFVVSRI